MAKKMTNRDCIVKGLLSLGFVYTGDRGHFQCFESRGEWFAGRTYLVSERGLRVVGTGQPVSNSIGLTGKRLYQELVEQGSREGMYDTCEVEMKYFVERLRDAIRAKGMKSMR